MFFGGCVLINLFKLLFITNPYQILTKALPNITENIKITKKTLPNLTKNLKSLPILTETLPRKFPKYREKLKIFFNSLPKKINFQKP